MSKNDLTCNFAQQQAARTIILSETRLYFVNVADF